LITTNGSYRNITATSEVIDREKKGWYMDLPGARERIVDTPMMVGNELVMNTLMPDSNACNPGGTGFLMAISPFNGTRLNKAFFDLDGDGFGPPGDPDPDDYIDGVPPTGIITTPKPPRVSKDPDPVIITNCPGGPCVEVTDINPTINAGMQSWREISK
jgi:type IV pilus assembly protein PilY1